MGGSSGGSSAPAAMAGYPSITVPNGYVMGLPVGILFFGRAWSEPTLLKLAYAYEQATHHRSGAEAAPVAGPEERGAVGSGRGRGAPPLRRPRAGPRPPGP